MDRYTLQCWDLMVVFFHLCSTKEDEFSVSIQPVVGELLLPVTMSEPDFTKEQSNANTLKDLDKTELSKSCLGDMA